MRKMYKVEKHKSHKFDSDSSESIDEIHLFEIKLTLVGSPCNENDSLTESNWWLLGQSAILVTYQFDSQTLVQTHTQWSSATNQLSDHHQA